MPSYKYITHILAAVLSAVAAFVPTPAGQALIHQYPWTAGLAGVVFTLAAVYHGASVPPATPVKAP